MPTVIKAPLTFYCRGGWEKGNKSKLLGYKSTTNKEGTLKYGLSKGKIYKLSTSVKVQPTLPSVQHSLSDVGMTMTANNSFVPPSHLSHHTVTSQSARGLHSVLNRQIVYDVFLPPMDRNAIESYMAVPAVQDEDVFPLNNNINNANDEDDNDDDINKNNDNNSTNNIDCEDNKEDHTNGHTKLPPPHHLLAELELMNSMVKHKLPLNTFKSIFQRAKKSQSRTGFDFCNAKIRSQKAIFDNLQSNLGISDMKFHPHILNWLPDNKPTQVYVHSFKDAIYSLLSNKQLMREENLSFPDYATPISPDNNPELNSHSVISELHHGSWWKSSWNAICNPNAPEILVPIIYYMDGISLDAHGRLLTLTPLNMTLGIFNVETHARPEAWTTIYFHPDPECPEWDSTRHSRHASSKEKIQNLHNSLEVVFCSFKDAWKEDGGIKWNYLPYANQQWKVKMKFAIAYVIGDTELHDKLCGKYGSFNKGVMRMCRHCNCYSPNINIPSVQPAAKKWLPVDFHCFPGTDLSDINKNFQNNSHHNIRNVFHDLCLGTNQNNIHFATPGECLHMHQLGTAKQAIESIEFLLHGSVPCVYAPNLKPGVAVANSIGHLAQRYGGLLSRQSDRDFPCTKFGTQFLSSTKKEGHDFSGMFISILIAMVSKHGSGIIGDHHFIKKQTEVIQLIVLMEEFLKHGQMKYSSLKNLPKTVVHFINCINSTCHRKGMETKLIKNHLYFHLTDYISLWGSPAGWDSGPNESHHETEIKAPSKNT
eukprot:jgi/Psemu1/15033/gm1.15033_g